MTTAHDRDRIRGRTIRWAFDDGPTAGTTFEHRFERDGHVTWRVLGVPGGEAPPEDRPRAAIERISDDVHVISYRAANGYTLTAILDFADGRVIAFASNSEQWSEQRGKFWVVR